MGRFGIWVVGVAVFLAVGVGNAVAAKPPAKVAWSPVFPTTGTYYGFVTVGSSFSATYAVTNSGGKATAALHVSLTGSPDFSITSDGCTGTNLEEKKTCSVEVTYAPTDVGPDSTELTVTAKKLAASPDNSIVLYGDGELPPG